MQLNFNSSFLDLYARDGLIKLDEIFLNYIKSCDEDLFYSLIEKREKAAPSSLSSQILSKVSSRCVTLESSQMTDSQLIIDLSYLLDEFIAKLFNIEKEIEELKKKHNDFAAVYKCKRLFVQRYALKKYADVASIDIDYVTNKLSHFLTLPITEQNFAKQVIHWFEDKENHKEEVELAAQYAAWRVKNENLSVIPVLDTGIQKQKMTSILFSTHKKIDHENLIPLSKKEVNGIEVLCSNEIKRRYGFDLTSEKPSLEKALDNAHYCIFCHKQNKDSCSKGLLDKSVSFQRVTLESREKEWIPVSSTGMTTGCAGMTKECTQMTGGYTEITDGCARSTLNNDNIFKKSPLNVELHGCPLEQKISEMNMVKSEGYSIASLAIVMIDNPLCAATGHRICNDCMNSCIYQKQEPVNVPMIETRTLDDVLSLPYGFEIYSLLSRWNPLNFQRPLPKENTGKNVLIVGQGPAGFNLAHHLLSDGHNVVAIDGLKIEPLIDDFQPIKNFQYEKLSERTAGGFGGVAEYGITSRWDKNYLKIIRLLLERRKNFALYGGIRFGSTITAKGSFNLGFDHIALALGSGKPKTIKIKNMLARGVRMASDFLMSLQLTGALKFDSIANLQVRMPVVVIGAGLTAIDTATEALAYYPMQVEKFLYRYAILVDKHGKNYVEKDWTDEEREIANEFISHAKLIREEYKIAKESGEEPKILELMQNWGGVKVIYRKELKDSPSYRLNSEEVQNALSEGIHFIENLEPVEILTDKYNHTESLKLAGNKSGEVKCIKARSIFIAAGTEPNTVIATEDKEHFKLNKGYFTHLDSSGKEVDQIFSPKMEDKDRILVYKQGNKAISFFGDLHPSYSGSVVKAMASVKNGYPIISQLLSEVNRPFHVIPVLDTGIQEEKNVQIPVSATRMTPVQINEEFFNKIKEQFTAKVIKVQYLTNKVVEIVIKAPLAARNFQPGQFFRLQNFEVNGEKANSTSFAMEGIAVTGTEVDKEKGIISTIVLETGGSSNLCKYLKEGEQIILMGPTGSPTNTN
ncbi:FAD-dependent oxidoreductase [Wolbachia endosymbiont of Folsomia candida]|uniref:FAD-dependent oxidoreductase n=1 Tax=Wolbachia endosymbiont of Folsomia candida TaxID=169402 RepID=UPI000B07D99C|nr:FAD-dependent oxidoreductase [Wolbachia endosymbiont of Folsomia candida]APR98213.1 glutamate synthase subunit beta [Wolbachia endosymbiont of Folsomia candida]